MGWLSDMADPDSEPKGWREKAEKERQEGIDVHHVQMESIKTPGNSSCLPLLLLLIVSVWAVLAFGIAVSRAVAVPVCGGGSCDASQIASNNTYVELGVHWCFWDATADLSAEPYPHEAVEIQNLDNTTHNFDLDVWRQEPSTQLVYDGPTLLIGPGQTKRWENVNLLYQADAAKIYLRVEGLWGSHPVWRVSGYHPNGPEPTWEDTLNLTYDRSTFDC